MYKKFYYIPHYNALFRLSETRENKWDLRLISMRVIPFYPYTVSQLVRCGQFPAEFPNSHVFFFEVFNSNKGKHP